MSPVAIAAVIQLLVELVKVSPEVSSELRAFFNKDNPTQQDFDNLKRRVMLMTLEEM